MMTFHVITIFPDIFDSYLREGVLSRALKSKKVAIKVYDLRSYTKDKHRKVDDKSYGGGPGMVLKVEPIFNCVKEIKRELVKNGKLKDESDFKTILFSAKGKRYKQADASRLTKSKDVILICGRYEGVDERVAKYIVDEEISVGEYVLTGGEIPALVVIDSISRLLPGVLGNVESLISESYSDLNKKESLDYPVYTKPDSFREWKVPEVLLGGNHQEIEKWREQQKNNRPVAK